MTTTEKITTILELVAKAYGISPAEIKRQSRRQPAAFIRQVVIYLAMENGVTSMAAAGFFNLHHATALHAKKCVVDAISVSPADKQKIESLHREISQ